MYSTLEMIKLLEKFISDKNSITTEELCDLRSFFSSESGKEAVEHWLREYWQVSSTNYLNVNFRSLYREIERKMQPERPVKSRSMSMFLRYAAVLVIPLLAGWMFLMFKQQPVVILSDQLPVTIQEYSCPAGMRSKIMLPDSTQVWLNASSTLQLREDFGYGTRTVMMSGEAFFKVSRKEGLPFIVSTPDVDIKVLGTSFNLSAYPEDEALEAVLVTGRIEVNNKRVSGRPASNFNMQPAQRMRWQKNEQTVEVKDNVNTELYSSWINNKLMFEDTPMEEVVARLERWFNVKIILQDEALKTHTFTGSFDDRTLRQILSYIGQSSSIAYRIEEDTVFLSIKK